MTYRPGDRVAAEAFLEKEASSILRFESSTGHLYLTKGSRAGKRACKAMHRGYRCMIFRGLVFSAHRIVWLLSTGSWPHKQLDHINGNRADNRIENLREASPAQNTQNQRRSIRNTSGFKGVTWHKGVGKWQASIKTAGKTHYLGLFDRAEEAHAAYVEAAQRLYGEFARAA